jgi:maltose O-acetyltransferase
MRQLLLNTVASSEFVPPLRRGGVMRRLGLDVGVGTVILGGQRFRAGDIRIGDRVFINRGCHFDPGSAWIDVEHDVALGIGVVLAAAGHSIGTHARRAGSHSARPIIVGSGSWLGARVVVLPGVGIAAGCVIGAGAVVTRSTEPDGVYVGVPARRVRDV